MSRAATILIALAGCTLPNPAYDEPTAGSAGLDTGTSAAPTSATTGPPPTTGAASTGSSGPGAPTGEATTTAVAATSGTDTSTGPDATTGGSTDTGEAGTTGAPATCWDHAIDAWPPATKLGGFADVSPVDPEISADGLSLVYVAGTDANRQLFRSSRAARHDPFPNGKPIALWNDVAAGYPAFALGFEELLVAVDGEIRASKYKPGDVNDQYDDPLPLANVNTGYAESHPNGVLDGTRLLLQRDDGPPTAGLRSSYRFWEFRREPPVALGDYSAGVDVSPQVPPLQVVLCPALAPDGLDLFFTSTQAGAFDKESASDVMRVFHTRRADLDAAWEAPTPLLSIPSTGGVLCPSSVSADGCALTYVEFPYGMGDPPYALYLSERDP